MPQLIFIIFLIIPAVLGLAEILHYLKLLILSPESRSDRFCLSVLNEENAVLELRAFCEDNNWSKNPARYRFVAVYSELSADALDECKIIAEKNGVTLLKSSELNKFLKELY